MGEAPLGSMLRPLDRREVALVLVDLQEGPLQTIGSMDPADLRANAVALCKIARLLELPTAFAAAEVPGPGGSLLAEPLAELPDAKVIQHATNDVWRTPQFEEAVSSFKRRTLAIGGLATDVGVMLAALGSVRAGLDTFVLVDVSATLDSRIELAAWLRLTQAGVRLTSWTAFAGEVQGNYLEPPGPAIRAVISERLRRPGVFREALAHR